MVSIRAENGWAERTRRAVCARTLAALLAAWLVHLPATAMADNLGGLAYILIGPVALVTATVELLIVGGTIMHLYSSAPRRDPTWSLLVGLAAIALPLVLAVATGAVSWWLEQRYDDGRNDELATACLLPHVLLALLGVGFGTAVLVRRHRERVRSS